MVGTAVLTAATVAPIKAKHDDEPNGFAQDVV
jgi:hypothetical protein